MRGLFGFFIYFVKFAEWEIVLGVLNREFNIRSRL